MDKSSITYSLNTTKEKEATIAQGLGMKSEHGIQRYLGLPAFSLRQKRLQFGYLKDRMEKKVQSWNQRDFSSGGKEVLLKSVVQVVPIYAMRCFRLSDSICDDMHKIWVAFSWGDKENERRLHWRRWEKMCIPKDKGGMGFCDFRAFNKALVAKQVWHMLTRPDSLVTRVFKAKYFKDGDLMNATIPARSSYVWRSIAWSRDLIKGGLGWKVGNGDNIRVLNDSWVIGMQGLLEGHGMVAENAKVEKLLNERKEWDKAKIEEAFWPHEVDRIWDTPVGAGGEEDKWYWKFTPNGLFTVKSAYLLAIGYYLPREQSSVEDRKRWGRWVWNTTIPPKVKIFMWRALSNIISAEANLRQHHVPIEGSCELCYSYWGTTEHTLIFCSKIKSIWRGSRY